MNNNWTYEVGCESTTGNISFTSNIKRFSDEEKAMRIFLSMPNSYLIRYKNIKEEKSLLDFDRKLEELNQKIKEETDYERRLLLIDDKDKLENQRIVLENMLHKVIEEYDTEFEMYKPVGTSISLVFDKNKDEYKYVFKNKKG